MEWGSRAASRRSSKLFVRRVVAALGMSAAIVALPFGSFLGSAGAAGAPPNPRQQLADELHSKASGQAHFGYKVNTDVATFMGTPAGHAIPRMASVKAGAPPEQAARGFLAHYGPLFGVADATRDLKVLPKHHGSAVHFQQYANGVPVMGGVLAVDVKPDGSVASVNGETLTDPAPPTTPTIAASQASATALLAIAKADQVPASTLNASTPLLTIYDNRILGAPGVGQALLVWQVTVTNSFGDVDELVLIDANFGGLALHFNQVERAKTRQVCDRNNVVGGAEVCSSPFTRSEGQAATGIADVDKAYDYAGATYDFYMSKFGRDSVDNAGLPLKNTVRYCPDAQDCPFQNAFWDQSIKQMVYGSGFASADDVVAHELTHGVTANESHLYYFYQSGALNESLSDVFGEFVDLTDGLGNDAANQRWMLGEDLPIGAIRNMANPPQFNQPDRTGSSLWSNLPATNGSFDNGGVHANSGVNNKAAFLLTDGGTFNGQTITGLGIDKVARIYYKLQTDLLTPAADYQDVYNLLPQACAALVGTHSITTTDCGQVTKTVLATQMNVTPSNAPATEAPVCDANQAAVNLFSDNLENTATGNWVLNPSTGTDRWYYPQNPNATGTDLTYATSGVTNFFGLDDGTTADETIARTANVAVPTGVSTYLRFNHAFYFEPGFDGGRIEYSTNNGTSWTDAGSLITNNGYTANTSAWGGNSFTNTSNGYESSRVNLTSLAGQNVRFRFHIKSDATIGYFGWWVDDIRVYRCNASAGPIANAGADKQVNSSASFTLDGSASSSPSGSTPLTYLWIQTSGATAVINNDRAAMTTVNGVKGAATLVFRLTVTDKNGQTATDDITITVKAPK